MKPIRAIIIDDDSYIRIQLRAQLEAFSEMIEVVADFGHPEEAMLQISSLEPELLFLDIQMPGMTGFQLLDKLQDQQFQVVFITSYDQYAIQAIRYSALDYLLKPIDDRELAAAISRCHLKRQEGMNKEKLENLLHNLHFKELDQQKIIIPFRSGEKQIAIADIISLEADSNYTWINLTNTGKLLTSRTLKDYEVLLNDAIFLRPNRSQIINKLYVHELIQGQEWYLKLEDSTLVSVSRRRQSHVRNAMM